MLKIGDTIKCASKDDAVDTMQNLAKEGIDTDFFVRKRRYKRDLAYCLLD